MTNFLLSAAPAFAVTIALAWLARVAAKAKPARQTFDGGRITPSLTNRRIMLGGAVLFGVGGVAAIAWGLMTEDLVLAVLGVPFIAFGAFSGWMVLITAGGGHDIVWDEHDVTGPSGSLLRRHPARTTIAWRDIIALEEAKNGVRSVRSHDGRKVIWGRTYAAYVALERAILERCSHLSALRP